MSLLVVVLLGLWAAWLGLAEVAVFETSDEARIEVDLAAHPIEAPVQGRVIASHLQLDREVEASEVLIELDAQAERLRLAEVQAKLVGIASELQALETELLAEQRSLSAGSQATRVERDELVQKMRGTDALADYAEQRAQRYRKLYEAGALATDKASESAAEANSRRSDQRSLALSIDRLEWQRR